MMRLRPQARAIYDAIVDELQKQGVRDFALTMRAKHPSVCFVVDGRERFVTFAGSPGDNVRAAQNQRSLVRKIISGGAVYQRGATQ